MFFTGVQEYESAGARTIANNPQPRIRQLKSCRPCSWRN